ncbi:MAG: Hsp20/alpha crystallin family protein [Chloroflexi bacterium]|jgi:HSP20 family protein|nr:Hsp20/alpha crystallin family protein [Chloroflexota bacterium]
MNEIETVDRIRVAPEVCSFVDDEHSELNIEISLPGVRKEDIDLKMRDDGLSLSALREDLEYVTTIAFCCPVSPDQANAEYDNGLLRVRVPFQDITKESVSIKIK